MSYRPHILFLSQCFPYPPHGGVTNRTYNILRQLQKEFDITLLGFSRLNHQPDARAWQTAWQALAQWLPEVRPPVPIPAEHSTPRRLWNHMKSMASGRAYTFYEYWSTEFQGQLREILSRREPDLIHIDSLDLYRWLKELPPVLKVCTHHSIESELLRLRAQRVKSRVIARYMRHQADLVERTERELCPQFSANVMMSDLDAARLRILSPGARTIVAPNGVDTAYFSLPTSLSPVPGRVVFLGPTYMFPNRDAVDYFLREVWSLIRAVEKSASFHLIGRSSPSDCRRYHSQPGVTCLGYVADVRPHIAEATCSVVPIRVGGGTRLKILDCWAMGKAVVSTSIGCEGLQAIDGKNILIRDTPETFAAAVLEVLSDSELRSQLEVNGRKTAEEVYSWDIVGRDLRAAYQCLLQARL
jgi:glycosyltransferase involved in cell wall biosynthesis